MSESYFISDIKKYVNSVEDEEMMLLASAGGL
jgi:hypothetical protein